MQAIYSLYLTASRERHSVTVVGAGTGSAVALLVPQYLIDHGHSWRDGYCGQRLFRWTAYILLIMTSPLDMAAGFNAAACILVYFFYHPRIPARDQSIMQILSSSLDWVGFALLTCFIVPLMMGLSWVSGLVEAITRISPMLKIHKGGTAYAWGSGHVIGSLATAAFFLIVLIARHCNVLSGTPLANFWAWSDRSSMEGGRVRRLSLYWYPVLALKRSNLESSPVNSLDTVIIASPFVACLSKVLCACVFNYKPTVSCSL